MANTPLVEVIEDKCTLCYACVRVCPVKAIEVKVNKNFAKIISNRCTGCGSCFKVCPADAIKYRSSIEETKALLKSDETIIAIVDPSISGEFSDITDYRKFVQMIKMLGFAHVNEVSFGADLIAAKYAELINNFNGKYYISANCPAVVSFIEKYHPELLSNVTPLVSPMIATANVVRKIYGNEVKVIYIGPCIATKSEALQYEGNSKVDSVLTFVELRELFNEFNINESNLEFSDFDLPFGYKGSLYPISNGILQAAELSEDLLTGSIITAEGRQNTINSVNQFESSIELIKKHFNLFHCEGCLMGPGTSKNGKKYIRRTFVTDYVRKRLSGFDLNEWNKNIKEHIGFDFTRTFKIDDQRLPTPPIDKINEVLSLIGKEHMIHHNGCESCGYESCEEFAIAVSNGLAKTEMCLGFSLKNRQEYIKSLKATNDKLAKAQEALKDSERIAKQEKEAAKEAVEVTTAMLQKIPSGVIIVDQNLKIIQSNQTFITLLGEEVQEINEVIPGLVGADIKTLLPYTIYNLFSYVLTNDENIINKDVKHGERLLNVSVFTIKKNKIAGAVIRDMYDPEIRQEESITRISEVIDKQLELVQKIGFLLGEGASESEQMLNSIMESFKSSKNKK